MANVPPAQVTVTSTIGAGQAVTASVLTNVVDVDVDFIKNTLKVTYGVPQKIAYFDYSAIATITWTVSAGVSTLAFS